MAGTASIVVWAWSLSQSLGDGGSRVVCFGCQGRNGLGLALPNGIDQFYCSHWDLGDSTSI
jgi:hypothetical protein